MNLFFWNKTIRTERVLGGKLFCSIRAEVWPVADHERMDSWQLKGDFDIYLGLHKKNGIQCYNLFLAVLLGITERVCVPPWAAPRACGGW